MAQIQSFEQAVASVGSCLEREGRRVADTEKTIRRLHEQKAVLDPVVLAQRETVNAVLAAHSARTAQSVWKERVIGTH